MGIIISRALENDEYRSIIAFLLNGKEGVIRPNRRAAFALQLEASLGLRIGDVLKLRVNNFKKGKMEQREEKTDKLQYRVINQDVYDYIKDYAIENRLAPNSQLFNVGVRAIQKQLKITVDYLGLENITTHSFRKMYATFAYDNNDHNLELVRELLNHTSIATTQRYVRVMQETINAASAQINFIT